VLCLYHAAPDIAGGYYDLISTVASDMQIWLATPTQQQQQ